MAKSSLLQETTAFAVLNPGLLSPSPGQERSVLTGKEQARPEQKSWVADLPAQTCSLERVHLPVAVSSH